MFFLPLIGSNQTANLIWVKFSTWRASIALNWLSLYSYSYFVLFIYLQCMYDKNLSIFLIIKQHYSFKTLLKVLFSKLVMFEQHSMYVHVMSSKFPATWLVLHLFHIVLIIIKSSSLSLSC